MSRWRSISQFPLSTKKPTSQIPPYFQILLAAVGTPVHWKAKWVPCPRVAALTAAVRGLQGLKSVGDDVRLVSWLKPSRGTWKWRANTISPRRLISRPSDGFKESDVVSMTGPSSSAGGKRCQLTESGRPNRSGAGKAAFQIESPG